MTSPPRLSVVIPTHDRRGLLLELLDALGRQTISPADFEVIVVIDGEDAETAGVISARRLPFALRVLQQPNSGAASARNRGARLAKGEAIAFLDDDLLPDARLLAEHLKFRETSEPTVVIGKLLPSGDDAAKRGWHVWEEKVLERHFAAMASGKRPAAGRRLYSGNFSVTRSAFIAAGGFDETYKRGEDIELGFRLEARGVTFRFNPQATAVHRGFRSFSSWRDSARQYGVTDIELAEVKGHRKALAEVFRWYRRQSTLARQTTQFFLGRRRMRSTLIGALRLAGATLTRMRMHGVAHYAYSGIYKLEYWHGVSTQLGGRKAFLEIAHDSARSQTAISSDA